MKSHLVHASPFTFDYYRPVFYQDNNGELQVNYSYIDRRAGSLTPAMGGQYVLTTDGQMEIDAEVRNVRDVEGTEIFTVNSLPYNLFVVSVEPLFDVYGRLIQWRHNLTRAAD